MTTKTTTKTPATTSPWHWWFVAGGHDTTPIKALFWRLSGRWDADPGKVLRELAKEARP